MIEKFLAYTNLLMKYEKESDEEKREEYRYQLMLLDANFKPQYREDEV